ncbi:MAG: glycosyltransferase [Planctomycetaceae bacterium]
MSLLNGTTQESIALTPDHCSVEKWDILRLRSLSTINKVRRFAGYLRSEKIEVLQLYFRDAMLVGVPAAYLAGVPRVVMTAFNDGYWMSPLDRWLYRRYQPFIHDMVVNCEAVKTSLVNNVSWPVRKITVIENGIDLDAYRNITPWVPPTTSSVQRRVGMIANLRSVKDPQTFIKAAAIVHARHPDTRFVLAGEGDLRHALETMIADLGLVGVVDLPGTIADTPAFLSSLDIAVLCSQSEGMSNAVIEYMAAGRPSIVTAVGGNSELITHEKTGLLVPPNSPVELAASIERYLDQPALALSVASHSRDEAFQRFSIQSMTDRYETFYRSLFLE